MLGSSFVESYEIPRTVALIITCGLEVKLWRFELKVEEWGRRAFT